MKDTTPKIGTFPESTPIVVSQTGNGDFKSIAKAVEHAKPGATIRIKSGFYEEAVVISKPLALLGDPEGLVVLAHSDFASFTVKSTELKIAHLALVSGLQSPSLDIRASKVELKDSVLWALDTSLKKFNPSLLPARGIVESSFLGASMKYSIPIRLIIANLLGSNKYGLGGSRSSGTEEGSTLEPFGSPDVILTKESSFSAANSFIGLASLVARDQSVMSFADCRFDSVSLMSWAAEALNFFGCEFFGKAAQPHVHITREEIIESARENRHQPDRFKLERDASLRLRVQEWASRPKAESASAENEYKCSVTSEQTAAPEKCCAPAQNFCSAAS
ncbi:MAG: hypothetical protein WCP06_00185 [Verrucomicrobiota bacterium]